MEELKSPLPCPNTLTVRRNPHRKARETPSSTIPRQLPLNPPSISADIRSFPLEDILSIELPSSSSQNPKKLTSENLKVFIRIRPLIVTKTSVQASKHGGREAKNAWPKIAKAKIEPKKKVKKIGEICVTLKDSNSVTVSPPSSLQESKRLKSKVYEGFSHVFSDESSQSEVYEKLVHPLVEDFLKGKSGMLAALGPSGSGKTHTVFGCVREPGMVPLALRHLFSEDKGSGNHLTGTFYLSMFEICSEKGKCERLFDLLREGSEIFIQQSAIKGLEEVVINNALEAESLIACGMLRRATAPTNSNSQSSRSQCIINICCIPEKIDGDSEDESKKASLTIVDLAGAEREKKTGNQGLRLVESNFINNTSMVFGQCLRSLLNYQKNPRKPLQKHFQNSLLTRYLRDYLEGKKRMALVLTVKPGEENYLETSCLLKQASPYTQIKFTSTEELGNSKCAKRPIQILPRTENLKKRKHSVVEMNLIGPTSTDKDRPHREENKNENGNLKEVIVEIEEFVCREVNEGLCVKVDPIVLAKRDRQHQIMANFAKALWDVLKQYKKKLEMAENELMWFKNELIYEKKRSSDLENEVNDLKFKLSSGDLGSYFELNNFSVAASCTGIDSLRERHNQKHESSCIPVGVAEIVPDQKDLKAVDMHPENGANVSITSKICANEICEQAVETTNTVEYPQVLDDSKEGDSVNNAQNLTLMGNFGIDDTCYEHEGTDELESRTSCLESCVEIREVDPRLVENESTISDATVSESAVTSPLSPVRSGGNSSTVKIDQMAHKQYEEELDPLVKATMPGDDASLIHDGHYCTAPENIANSLPTCESQDKQKPKRRLLPISSNLLKDIGNLSMEDANDKLKGVKGDKGTAMEARNKSKGNISLLRLLRKGLYR